MKKPLFLSFVLLTMAEITIAADKIPLKKINPDSIITELQPVINGMTQKKHWKDNENI